MRIFKSFLVLTLLIGVTSCDSEQKNIEIPPLNVDKKESLSQKNVSEKKGEFSNPAIIFGTDFLTFFKSLRKLGKFDDMIKFTSSESIKKYGKSELIKSYQNNFTNLSKIELHAMDTIFEEGKIYYIMHYSNFEFATKRAFDIKIVIENDSTKLVYEKKFPF